MKGRRAAQDAIWFQKAQTAGSTYLAERRKEIKNQGGAREKCKALRFFQDDDG